MGSVRRAVLALYLKNGKISLSGYAKRKRRRRLRKAKKTFLCNLSFNQLDGLSQLDGLELSVGHHQRPDAHDDEERETVLLRRHAEAPEGLNAEHLKSAP